MKALDLFCGAGGTATGLKQAGFKTVTGVDIEAQPEYPFRALKENALNYSASFIREFDFVWASPPCQNYTWASGHARNKGKQYPDLVKQTRELLEKAGVPFVIENVPQAPIRKDLLLCGEMFGLRVIRHRAFEVSGFKVTQPKHPKHKPPIIIEGKKKKKSWYMQVAGHGGQSYSFKLKDWQKAMGITHIQNKKMLCEAVPPAYSKYIGEQFIALELQGKVK